MLCIKDLQKLLHSISKPMFFTNIDYIASKMNKNINSVGIIILIKIPANNSLRYSKFFAVI